MGLRTTTLSAVPARDVRPSEVWARQVRQLVGSATAAMRARRFDDLGELFEEIETWQDEQRAYQARRELVELAFDAQPGGGEGWIELYAVVAERLLAALESNPAEPVLLNYGGVLLYELYELGGAEALFRAAAALDPETPHVRGNLKAVRERKRAKARLQLPGRFPARALALGVKARRIATAARPAEGLTISLCMIVKDEEEMLPGCLEAIAASVDEIVVVDTGSTDRTREIAGSFGARVVDFPWNGSFSDARNVSLEHATSDWVVYLDADEHLVPEDAAALRALLGRTWREAFYLVETNYTGGEESGSAVTHMAMRVFRNRPHYRFEGRIHEQKTQSMPTYLPERFEPSTVRVRHYGYLKSRISEKDKSRRNIELLQGEARENPSPFNSFNLGSEHVVLGDTAQARACFESAWAELRVRPEWETIPYVPLLVSRLVSARRESGDPAAGRELARQALASLPGFTDLVFHEALCARDEGDLAEAERLAERCLELGDAPARYSPTVGSGTHLALCLLAELRPGSAEELYRRSLAEYPDYVAPVLPLAVAMLRRGASPDEVVAAVPTEKPSAMLMLATACYESGAAEAAEAWFRRVLERQPANGAARIGVVEALLSQRRYRDAAREAAAEPAESPVRPLAATAELFALAADADVEGLRSALRSAAESGAAPHELELHRAWAASLAGAAPPSPLSPEAAAVAVTCLEALLRVEDVDAFASLLPVYEGAAVALRERREVLARMYLRRGFLDSAADEWIAVAQERPDSRAFIGLAQVAVAKQLPEEALDFARAALELDPQSGDARRLLGALERRLAA